MVSYTYFNILTEFYSVMCVINAGPDLREGVLEPGAPGTQCIPVFCPPYVENDLRAASEKAVCFHLGGQEARMHCGPRGPGSSDPASEPANSQHQTISCKFPP